MTTSGIIEDATKVDYYLLHTVLRNENYKFHHLPGRLFRFYNMANDPGEKNDLSKKMLERTAQMTRRCRAKRNEIAARNRTFSMRQLRINNADSRVKSWALETNRVLHFEGEMKSVSSGGIIGFRSPGARVD